MIFEYFAFYAKIKLNLKPSKAGQISLAQISANALKKGDINRPRLL